MICFLGGLSVQDVIKSNTYSMDLTATLRLKEWMK